MQIGSPQPGEGASTRPTRSVVPVTFALLTSLTLLLVSCHFEDARNRCSEMSQQLYEARASGQPDQVRAALTSSWLSATERDGLVSTILNRDATCGRQVSRHEYLRVASHVGTVPDKWYSVRNKYEITYSTGTSWEELLCHVDDSGRAGAIVGVNLGPLPAR
jgi:hypothetical protein